MANVYDLLDAKNPYDELDSEQPARNPYDELDAPVGPGRQRSFTATDNAGALVSSETPRGAGALPGDVLQEPSLTQRIRNSPFVTRLLGEPLPEVREMQANMGGGNVSPMDIVNTGFKFASVPPQAAEPLRKGNEWLSKKFLPDEMGGIEEGAVDAGLGFPIAAAPVAFGEKLGTALLGVFSGDYVLQLPEQKAAFDQAMAAGDKRTAYRIATSAILNGAVLGMGAAHEAMRMGEHRTSNIERPTSNEDAAAIENRKSKIENVVPESGTETDAGAQAKSGVTEESPAASASPAPNIKSENPYDKIPTVEQQAEQATERDRPEGVGGVYRQNEAGQESVPGESGGGPEKGDVDITDDILRDLQTQMRGNQIKKPATETPPAAEHGETEASAPEVKPVEQRRLSKVGEADARIRLGAITTVGELRELRQKWEESPDDDRQQHMLELINERINDLQNERGRSLSMSFTPEGGNGGVDTETRQGQSAETAATSPETSTVRTAQSIGERTGSVPGNPGMTAEEGSGPSRSDVAATDSPGEQSPPAQSPKKKILPKVSRADAERPPDIIDYISGNIGTKIRLSSAREIREGYKPKNAARSLFSSDGYGIDKVLDDLRRDGQLPEDATEDDLLQAIDDAADARKGWRKRFYSQERQLNDESRQQSAWDRETNRPGKAKEPIVPEDLNEGDAFKVKGADVRVKKLHFDDDGEVIGATLEDGKLFGTREVEAGQQLQVDKGSLQKSAPPESSENSPFSLSKTTKERPTTGTRKSDVESAVAGINRNVPRAKARVVQSEADLPAHLQDEIRSQGKQGQAEGVYDLKTGRVYLVADNLRSPRRAMMVWAHEVIAHGGLREFLGSDFNRFMDHVFEGNWGSNLMRDIVRRYGFDLTDINDRRAAADEFCARLAEHMARGEKFEPTVWNRIVTWVKQWLREKWGKNIEVTPEEIRVMLSKAKRGLERANADTTPGTGARFSKKEVPEQVSNGKYWQGPGGKLQKVDLHEESAARALGREYDYSDPDAEYIGEHSGELLRRGFARVSVDAHTIYAESKGLSDGQLRELKNQAIETRKVLKLDNGGSSFKTLYDPRDSGRFSLGGDRGNGRPDWLPKDKENEIWKLARDLVAAGEKPDQAMRVALQRLRSENLRGFDNTEATRWAASLKPMLEEVAGSKSEIRNPKSEPAEVPESGTGKTDEAAPSSLPNQPTPRVQQLRDQRLAELERLNRAQQQIRDLQEKGKRVPPELKQERQAARQAVLATKQALRNDVEHAEALHMDLNTAGNEYADALKTGDGEKIWQAEGKLNSLQAEVEDLPAKVRDQSLRNLQERGQLPAGEESTWKGDPALKPPGWDENWSAPKRTDKNSPSNATVPTERPDGDPKKPEQPYYGLDSWPRGGLRDMGRDLVMWQRRLAAWWKARGPRAAMTYLFDGAMGRARNIAKMGAGTMLHELNRAFGVEAGKVAGERDPLREAGFAFAIEADGDRSKLGEWRDLILQSDEAGTRQGRQALAALAFADKNWETFNKPLHGDGSLSLVELHQEMTSLERGTELNAGLDVPEWKGNYVKHAANPDEMGVLQAQDQGGGIGQGFTKKRLNPTLADDIAQGVPLKSLSAIDLLESRIRDGQQNVNAISWLNGLKEMKDPTTQQPLVTDVQTRYRGDRTPYDHVPAGYKIVQVGRVKFGMLRGYDGVFGDLTNPSWFSSGGGKRFVQKSIATAKHIVTFFDTMHLGVEALRNFLLTGKVTYSRGLTLLDNSLPELRRMLARGEIPQEWGRDLERQKAALDLGVRQGVNLTDLSSNLHRGWLDAIEHIPVIGAPSRFNRWLFSNYVRGAMAQAYLLKYEGHRAAFPNEHEAVSARTVGRDINSIFGSIGNQGLFRSKTGQDWARIFFFAPYWNETLARTELGGVGQLAKVPFDSAKAGRYYISPKAQVVGYGVLGLLAANQVINLATRGKPTWDNEEEGLGAKLSAWIPDFVGGGPGFFLNPYSISMKLTHLLQTKIERNLENSEPGFWSKTGAVVKGIGEAEASRLTPLGRAGLVPITRRDALGRPLRDKEIVPEMLSTLVPKPMSSEALYRGGKQVAKNIATGNNESEQRYQGQFQRQLFSSGGVLLDQAPTSEQRIGRLARAWNAQHGVPENAEFNHGDFEGLDAALRRNNSSDANDELETLLKKKTAEQVIAHYSRRAGLSPTTGLPIKVSMTGNRLNDAFMSSLNESQQKAYADAINDRMGIYRAVAHLLAERDQTKSNPQ